MKSIARWTVCTVATLVAVPANAQQADFLRRSFAFFDHSLTLEVVTESDGMLRVIRGKGGRIDIAGRSAGGINAVGLGGWSGDRLTLTAAGADHVEYVVTVPEQVSLHLVLPDQPIPTLAEAAPAVTYRWSGNVPAPGAVAFEARAPLMPTYVDPVAPTEIALGDLMSVAKIGVRHGGDVFRIEASRPLTLTPGRRDYLELQVRGEPIDLVIHLPFATREFTLRSGETVIVEIREGTLSAPCSPAIQQRLPDGRGWVDYTPQGGRLTCPAR